MGATHTTIATRTARCKHCGKVGPQELRVPHHGAFYVEMWVCVACVRANRSTGIQSQTAKMTPAGTSVREMIAATLRARPRSNRKPKR